MQRRHKLQISRSDNRFGLRALLSALLASLLLGFAAAAARADVQTGPWTPETQETGGQTETPVTGQETPTGTEQVAGSGEAPSEAPTPPPEAPAEVVEAPTEAPPTETQQAPPTEPVVSETPAPVEPSPTPVGTLPDGGEAPVPQTSERPEEQVSGKASEETAAGGGSATRPSSDPPASSTDVRFAVLETPSGSADPAVGSSASADQVAMVSAQQETAQAGTSRRAALAIASRQAGRFSCELSALGGNKTDNCTAGWLTSSPSALVATPTSAAVAAVSSLVAVATVDMDSSTGGGHSGGFATSGSPLSSAPGPAPSGASGGAGASASGAGVSIFLTLAGLLLLGAPRAMRRLRLSFEPWLAGCFVLIPERPD